MTLLTTLLLIVASVFTAPPDQQWGGPDSGASTIQIELITDADGFSDAWKRTHGGSLEGLPSVDFTQARVVLALRGTAPDVQCLEAVDLEVIDSELRLTIDASPRPSENGDPLGTITTAWGLFVVPMEPERVRVGYLEAFDDGRDSEFRPLALLSPENPSLAPSLAPSNDRRRPDESVEFEPDYSLLKPRRMHDRDEDVDGSPHAILYHRDNKQLLFIGAKHQRDIENAATHQMVRVAMEGFLPQAVIVEGVPTSAGTQPERLLDSAQRRIKTGQLGESAYAAVLGDRRGAVVVGGEPDPQATTDAVRAAGFSEDDLLGFLVARNLTTAPQPGTAKESRAQRITRVLAILKRRFNIDSTMNPATFNAWFEIQTGAPFDPARLKREVSPRLVDKPSALRQIAIIAMTVRERNLVALEAKMLGEHDRVLVVYGSGHLRWERALLQEMLGDPVLVTNDLTVADFDRMNQHFAENRKAWTRPLTEPPAYFVSHGYDAKWADAMTEGIDAARDYLGNYGPLQVYVLGQEHDELSDPEHREQIARVYCGIHNQGSEQPFEDCLEFDGRVLAQKAVEGSTEAYLTMAMEADPPRAEIVFINPHGFGGEDMATRSIHEYTHVFQKAFDFTPTWMMEGGAELLACHLGEDHGWGDRDQTMRWYAQSLENAGEFGYTIRDMEEIETAGPLIARYHRELAYDAGAWAVAYLISHTPSRRIGTYFRDYFPLVDQVGWEQALCDSTDFATIDAFYQGFEVFMDQPLDERMGLLKTLRD